MLGCVSDGAIERITQALGWGRCTRGPTACEDRNQRKGGEANVLRKVWEEDQEESEEGQKEEEVTSPGTTLLFQESGHMAKKKTSKKAGKKAKKKSYYRGKDVRACRSR